MLYQFQQNLIAVKKINEQLKGIFLGFPFCAFSLDILYKSYKILIQENVKL